MRFIIILTTMLISSIYANAQSTCESDRAYSISSSIELCTNFEVIGCETPGIRLPVGFDNVPHPIPGGVMMACWYDDSCQPGGGKHIWSYFGAAPCDPKYNSFAETKLQTPRNQNLICGSIVEHEKQVLGESIPVVGAPFALNYFTSWSQGRIYDYELLIPIAGDNLRSGIDSFDIIIKNDSTVISTDNVVNNQTNYTYSYHWDGLNNSSVPTLGSVNLDIIVEENRGTQKIVVHSTANVGSFKSELIGLGGWVPSRFAFYDFAGKRLYLGSGEIRSVNAMAYGTGTYLIAAEDGSEVYIFNNKGLITEIKTALLGATVLSFTYDSNNKILSVSEPFGKVTTFERDLLGNLTGITAPFNHETILETHATGLLKKVTNPNSESFEMTYDSSSRLLKTFKKPMGQISTFDYDSKGHLIQDAHSGGYFFDLVRAWNSSYKYDVSMTSAMGRVTQVTSNDSGTSATKYITYPNGSWGSSTYSVNGTDLNTETSSQGLSLEKRFRLDPRFGDTSYHLLRDSHPFGGSYGATDFTETVVLSDPDDPFAISSAVYTLGQQGTSNLITTNFNPTTNEFLSTSALGNTSKIKIDSFERPVEITKGNQTPIQITYLNDKVTQISQGSATVGFTHSSSTGLMSTMTDAQSKTYGYVYDDSGRVTSVVYPDLRILQYGYDANGNISSITPPGRPAHNFSINSSEVSASYVAPALIGVTTSTTTYTYNLDKQLTGITRPDGSVITYSYGANSGLLESVSAGANYYSISNRSNNRMPEVILTPEGIRTVIDYLGPYNRGTSTYDMLMGSNMGTYNLNLNSDGRISSDSIYASTGSGDVSYGYDTDGNLISAGDLELAYSTPNAELTGTSILTGPNAVTDSFEYNANGNLESYEAKYNSIVLYSLDFIRDLSGRVIEKDELLNGVATKYEYQYDDSGRLESVKKNTLNVANYGYDDNGNRVSGNIGAQVTTGIYDDQDRMNTYNIHDYTYNANGELQSKVNSLTSSTTNFAYNVLGQLNSVTLPSSAVVTYEVDGLGRRVGKKIGGVLQARWVYIDQLRIGAELTSSGAVSKRFIYGSKTNTPDYMIYGGDNYRIISDNLGSPRLVVKVSDGSVVQRMNHDEFGRVIEDTNPGFTPFGFAGGLYDSDSGLVRFGARDYDPEAGRWTSKDPILFNGQMSNLYGYSFHDPVNYVDLDGRNPVVGIALIVGGTAAVGAISSGVTTYLMTGSYEQTGTAFVNGAITGAAAGAAAIGAVVFGAPAGVMSSAVGILVGLGTNIANAPGALPEGGIEDFSKGIKRINNPDANLCQ